MRGGARIGAGRPRLPESEKGRKTEYKTFSVSCLPSEYEKIKAKAEQNNRTVSRFIVETILKKKAP